MKNRPLTVHIMTANLSPGDAIGNYILTSARIWRQWGARVYLYADHIDPVYGGIAQPSDTYHGRGDGILWFHYSIYAENHAIATASPDFKIMDYHGISPPRLFAGQDSYLQQLCQKGIDFLPHLATHFDAFVVHSEYTREELAANECRREAIYKLPLVVDTDRLGSGQDDALTTQLEQVEYLLFVGRIVPQKDILSLLKIYEAGRKKRPQLCLILAGTRHLAGDYQRQLDQYIRSRGLSEQVLFVGQINAPAMLASLLANARLLLVTSEWESFCVPVVEALYFGTPPVVHAVPPLPEVAGEAGVVIDKNTPVQAATTIAALLDDDARYQSLAQAAEERAQYFTDAALRETMLAMLQQLFLENSR